MEFFSCKQMKTSIFNTIENILKISFLEEDFEVGSVCFANDEEVRSDFKLELTTYDVVNYVYGIYQLYWEENQKIELLDLKIPYPESADFFWKYANSGKKFRLEHPIKEIEFLDVTALNWQSIT